MRITPSGPILLLAGMALHADPALALIQATQEAGTIQVTGQARVSVPPDMVRVTFAVETEESSAGEASHRNAAAMEAVLAALRTSPAEGLTIETYGYDLQPVYGRATAGEVRRIEGYRALNHVGVSAKEVSAAGSLIDLAVGAGANRVASLQFQISDPGPARLEALREAVAMAREEARTIADAMGVPLGPPLEVQGGSSQPRIMEMALQRMEMAAAPGTPIEAGLQTVSASVTIKYRLGSRDR